MKKDKRWGVFDPLRQHIKKYKHPEKNNSSNDGDPPMNKFQSWLQEKKWLIYIWLIIFYLIFAASLCLTIDISGELEYKIEYRQPWDEKISMGNKK